MIQYIKILNTIARYNKMPLDVSVEAQRRFFERIPIPRDLIDRSYVQYRCHNFYLYSIYRLVFNIGALVAFPIVLCWLLLKPIPQSVATGGRIIDVATQDDPMMRMVPISLTDTRFWHVSWRHGVLRKADLTLLRKAWVRYPFAFYFLFKNMVKIAMYRYETERYKPDAIIVHNEYSFTSSVLTEWCRRNGIQHINFMHGERIYSLRCAFFEYDRCYVWHEYYKQLYCSVGASPEQFIVEVPDALQITLSKWVDKVAYADFKYILAGYSEKELQQIVSVMDALKERYDRTVKYRPHPRYSDVNLLRKYVKDDEIEDPKCIPIEKSIANTRCVVGSYSTVLLQAYLSGVHVAMDDVTYNDRCRQLKERGYMLMQGKNVWLLSDLLDLQQNWLQSI